MINEPVQKLLLALGRFGCLFLCIIRAVEISIGKALNELVVYMECAKRTVQVDGKSKPWIDAECYVNAPALIFSYLMGGEWEYRWESLSYTPVEGDIVFLRYELKQTAETLNHFCLGDLEKICIYDPMGASNTRINGVLAGLRILSRKK